MSIVIDTNSDSLILAIASRVPCVSNVQEAPDRLVPVATCPLELVEQRSFGPRRLASRVPVDQERQGVRIAEREAPHEPAADAKRVHIAVLSRDGRRHGTEVAARTFLRMGCDVRRDRPNRRRRLCRYPR